MVYSRDDTRCLIQVPIKDFEPMRLSPDGKVGLVDLEAHSFYTCREHNSRENCGPLLFRNN